MSHRPLGTKADATHASILELCADPPSAPELVEEVAERVRRVVPFDSGAWMTSDPETLLPTSIAKQGPVNHELGRAFTQHELLGERTPDVGSYLDLIARGQSAAGLALLTGGDRAQARVYDAVHVPFGLGDELRLVARSAGTTWALGCMSRGTDVPDFTAEEVRWVGGIAEQLGHGVRRALSRTAGTSAAPRGPGMLVLDADGTIEAATGEADRWLAGLDKGPAGLPVSIMTVALQAQANATGRGTGRAARARLQLPSGAWLLVHADVLRQVGNDVAKIAVVLEPADRAELLPLLLALHGLTDREREVCELLVAGHATEEIAARMHISRHTLRDYTKAIFAKVGVTSRPELTAVLGLAA